MLKIRLQRVGRKREPVFRLVVCEHTSAAKKGAIEILGFVDLRNDKHNKFDADKIKQWISNGAQPSDTVHNLLVSEKIIEGKKINVLPKKTPIVKEEEVKEEVSAEVTTDETSTDETSTETEAPKEEEAKEEAPKEEVKEDVSSEAPANDEAPKEESSEEKAE
jgi:small subunit ribosomal protein S16